MLAAGGEVRPPLGGQVVDKVIILGEASWHTSSVLSGRLLLLANWIILIGGMAVGEGRHQLLRESLSNADRFWSLEYLLVCLLELGIKGALALCTS